MLKKDADLFPDNYTRREILQKRMVCPYSSRGCTAQLIPFDVDGHVKICEFRKTNEKSVTPVKSKIVCNFKEVGCDCVFTTQEQINYHMTSEMQKHLQVEIILYLL